jgi:molecular chaperone DnaK
MTATLKEKLSFGIDFGTTNSIAAAWGNDILKIEKRPVAFWDASEGRLRPHASVVWYSAEPTVTVGNQARAKMQSLGGVMGNRFIRSIKRRLADDRPVELLGGQRVAPYEVAAEIFRHLKRDAERAEVLRGREMDECVVTVPVTFTGPQRREIRRAIEHTGMRLRGFLHEPFAALISHFYDPDRKLSPLRDQRVLIFDWGGGTLDVCIAQMSKDGSKIVELAHSGIEDRAGDDFDHRVMASVRASFLKKHPEISDEELELQGDAQDRFWIEAEASKIDLSSAQKTNVTVASFFQKDGKNYDLQETISRGDFESLIGEEIDAAVRCVERCLKDARLTPGCIDHLLLVGGTSKIPLIRSRLENLFGHKVQVAHEPDAAIARGASIVAAEGWKSFNALPVGVKLCDGAFFEVLKKGAPLDATSSRRIVFYCTDWRVGSANLLFCRKAVAGDKDFVQMETILQVPTKHEITHEGDLDRIIADFAITPDATLRCDAQSATLGQIVQCEIHDITFGLALS